MNTPTAAAGLAHCHLPTPWGTFDLHALRDAAGLEHAALSCGDLSGDAPVLTRLHSECLTGDVFGSARCDCRGFTRWGHCKHADLVPPLLVRLNQLGHFA